jgi:hypothetical protein
MLADACMIVKVRTPRCVVCGKTSTVLLDKEKFDRWQAGEHIQNVWPEMPADNREVLISGTHPECWEKLFE